MNGLYAYFLKIEVLKQFSGKAFATRLDHPHEVLDIQTVKTEVSFLQFSLGSYTHPGTCVPNTKYVNPKDK